MSRFNVMPRAYHLRMRLARWIAPKNVVLLDSPHDPDMTAEQWWAKYGDLYPEDTYEEFIQR